MIAGAVPVVANVGDLGELVSNGESGWLIEPGDFDAYADKIYELLENSAEWSRLSLAAQRKAFENNAVPAIVARWQHCLSALVATDGALGAVTPSNRKSVVGL